MGVLFVAWVQACCSPILSSGFACAFAALCYAELASTMPVSGSSYTYAYATLGEIAAWTMGWLIVLEYGVAGATVAVGFSGYFVSLLADFGLHVPAGDRKSTRLNSSH